MAREGPVSVESACGEPFRQSMMLPMINCGSAPTMPISVSDSRPSTTIPL